MELIDPANGGTYRGSDITLPIQALAFRCSVCEGKKENRRNTLLFKGVLASGTIIEVLCRRCKTMHRFMAGKGS